MDRDDGFDEPPGEHLAWTLEDVLRLRDESVALDEVPVCVIGDDAPERYPILVGYRCGVCLRAVYRTPSGPACVEGHGGAEEEGDIDDPPATRVATDLDAVEPSLDTVEVPDLFLPDADVEALDAAASWRPSPDQEDALRTLLSAFAQPGTYVLTGAAGSGKSTVMRALIRRLTAAWTVVLLAPTWRAALRLREVTGRDAHSVHSAVYGRPVEERLCPCGEWQASLMKTVKVDVPVEPDGGASGATIKLPRYVCDACGARHEDATAFSQRLRFNVHDDVGESCGLRLVIVDEASMVPAQMAQDIERAFAGETTRILYVGDPNQLPPVSDKSVADAAKGDAPGVDLLHPTATLTHVHRQAEGDPVIGLAHTLKVYPEQSTVTWPFPFRLRGVDIRSRVPMDVPATWAADLRRRGEDVALVTYSNRTRARLNHDVRHHSGALAYAGGAPVIPGDRLLSRANRAGLYNGDVVTVCAVEHVTGALLSESGRMPVSRPAYEHDRLLGGGVWVLRLQVAAVGGDGTRRTAHVVLPPARPFESDAILQGVSPEVARQYAREFTRAWCDEYERGVKDRDAEFREARHAAELKVVARAKFEQALDRRELRDAARLAARQGGTPAWLGDIEQRIARGDFDDPDKRLQALAGVESPRDVALDVESVQAYCTAVYGAVDPATVIVVDRGEALTCYAMQGSQAKHVGVVFDGPFWGCWKNDRVAGLQWAYTSVTRTSGSLSLFSIAREAK